MSVGENVTNRVSAIQQNLLVVCFVDKGAVEMRWRECYSKRGKVSIMGQHLGSGRLLASCLFGFGSFEMMIGVSYW